MVAQVTEVVPGIHQFKVPLPMEYLPYVLVYCIRGDDGYTLIDCGWNTEEAWNALTDQLRSVGADVRDVAHLIVTHIHPDHYGLAGRLKEATGCEVVLHEREQKMVPGRYTDPSGLLDHMKVWLKRQGVPEALANELHNASMPTRQFVTEVEPDTKIRGGERRRIGPYTFEALWTPGHSPGHICLVEHEAGFMMTGDHVLPSITPNVSLHPQQEGNPLGEYIESLEKIKPLNIRRGLAAHEHVIEDLPKRLEELEEHHHRRLEEMLRAVASGAETAHDVAAAIVWTTGTFDTFSPWQKRAAISETLAHLEYARSRGMVTAVERGGVVRYLRVD
ncbi:MAG TPA: MBL fold metallo-hydrolase [Dehalococcoidia bacterium]|nr:MBL fold metallo-hydrolase [Dehalococcoidia bacterium]